jgi:hypothetical protein
VRDKFKYGLIYAIKLDPTNISELSYSRSMGIKSFRSIRKDEIVGAFKVPRTFEHTVLADKKRFNAISDNKVLSLIRRSEAAQQVN